MPRIDKRETSRSTGADSELAFAELSEVTLGVQSLALFPSSAVPRGWNPACSTCSEAALRHPHPWLAKTSAGAQGWLLTGCNVVNYGAFQAEDFTRWEGGCSWRASFELGEVTGTKLQCLHLWESRWGGVIGTGHHNGSV